MRRLLLVPALVAALTLTACSATTSGSKKTVTVYNTVSAASGAASGPAVSGSAVPSPSGSASVTVLGSTTAKPSTPVPSVKPSSAPASSAPVATSAAPVVKVDPLKASCPALLSAADVKKAIGATIGATNSLVKLGAGTRGVKGALRCLYGATGTATAPVRVRLTQYDSAASAKKQIQVDAQSASVTPSTPTVSGYPSVLLVQNGATIEVPYDSWTVTIAVEDKVAPADALTTGMPMLAALVLARVLKNG